jgi:predicted RNase H-like nuclease (RuvC/YqgF family)
MTAVLIVFIVIGIPVLGGLALGAYKEWLKHRGRFATRAEIEELKTQLARLQAENQNLRQRLENLETIIVSEVWEKRGSTTGASQPNIDISKTLE